MNAATLAAGGLVAGDQVRVRQGGGSAVLFAGCDDRIPAGCVRVSGGHPLTAELGPISGRLTLEAVVASRQVRA